MLSVAKCGYDNEYGTRHHAADLAVLKQYEEALFVAGGEYSGRLYWFLVCLPATGDRSAKEYYRTFQPSAELADMAQAIEAICRVMIRNYDISGQSPVL